MSKNKKKRQKSSGQNKPQRIQCHFVSNTHWDREWRFSFQKTRYNLIHMMDILLDVLQKEPKYKSFHLDSQSVPIQDYLELRPEKESLLKKFVRQGRIMIGPWFTLPDEFSVGGESLIRNLLLGHKISRGMGRVCKTGYSPFSWGQISQMPQIYQGFGINVAAFYHGINKMIAPNSEIIWEGPDGTQILVSCLGKYPRSTVFYLIQKWVFWDHKADGMIDRTTSWNRGHGPFKLINKAMANQDYQLAHPRFEYKNERIPELAHKAIEHQNNDWSTLHRLWLSGDDVSWPDIREVQMAADCNKALGDVADVFQSTCEDFQKALLESVSGDLPVVKGEMRHFATKGSTGGLIGEIITDRMHVKQENFRTERDISALAEPAAVFATLLGAPYQQAFVDEAYNQLLQNHPHDSIGCCSRDIIAEDVLCRLRQSRQISESVLVTAMRNIAGSVDLSEYNKEDVAVTVYNPASFQRTEVVSIALEVPREWESNEIELFDQKGKKVPLQLCERISRHFGSLKAPTDGVVGLAMDRYDIHAQFKDVPPFGYRTFFAKPPSEARLLQPKTMCTGPQTMENEYIAVTVNPNGTLKVQDKKTGKVFDNLGYFHDSSEVGDAWIHRTAPHESIFTTLNEKAQIALQEDGELKTTFRITINWSLPESCTENLLARSSNMKPYAIVNTVTLRKGQPWVEIVTELDNNVRDHNLQVAFPTNLKTDEIMVQGHFDVLKRSFKKPDYSLYTEKPQASEPMNSFLDVSNGKAGLGLLNEGLKAYETQQDPARTVSFILLRCFPIMFCAENMWDREKYTGRFTRPEDTTMQCPGRHSFRYGIMPHAGNWEKANIWQASERFNLDLFAAQIGPTEHGSQPLTKSFLEIKPDNLHISAIKQSESGKGWVVRLFNPFERTVAARIRLNSGRTGPMKIQSPVERLQAEYALPKPMGRKWRKVRLVTLEEVPEKNLKPNADGWVSFEITKKKIVTVEFLPI